MNNVAFRENRNMNGPIFNAYKITDLIESVSKEKNIESALRTYKSKVQKTKQIQQLRDRQTYVKPSVEKRTEKLKAVYIEKKRNGLN